MQKQIDEVMGLVDDFADKKSDLALALDGQCSNVLELRQDAISSRQAVHAKLPELLPVWQPIDESTPTDGREVLAGFQGQFRWVTAIAVATENHGVHASGYGKFTHWMPLPKAPE